MSVENIDHAILALAQREDISDKNKKYTIGHWVVGNAGSEHTETEAIGKWAYDEGISGVVWTALKPKYAREYRTPTVDEVIEHLLSLEGHSISKAEEYVRKAPPQIKTEYRSHIEANLGWTYSP